MKGMYWDTPRRKLQKITTMLGDNIAGDIFCI